ncbi:MAG TPA: metallophosphoesterase [Opitutaceae bacterium]|jgi:hypothetical protein|nr:metallophosphoesterase [Opitutaceae bacterium]
MRLCRALLLALAAGTASAAATPTVTFVFTSDVHFGIARGKFRGAQYVDATIINAAEVQKINTLPGTALPQDGGLRAGEKIGAVDFVVITGDLANRQELYPIHIQPAAASWAQFQACYLDGLRLRNAAGQPSPLLLVPGNHDVSDAIGAPTKMVPATDPTSMVQIYNRMMHPAVPLTPATYAYPRDTIIYAKDFGGAHCIFLTMWPDSFARAWIDRDLARVPAAEPVFLFCHDPPDIDARHLINPYGDHGINAADAFENLVHDVYADGDTAKHKAKPDGETTVEQRALAAFLRRHPNIVGYFHGHANWNEVYTWKGPDGDLALNVFRVDSPMKGKTAKEEKEVSFQVVTYNAGERKLTDRECLWNSQGKQDGPGVPVAWGSSATVSLAPHR